MQINAKNILIDGKRPGDVIEFQITYSESCKMCTVKYTVEGKERVLTCELEAISFGA